MRNRALRPIVAVLSILLLTGVPAHAAPVVVNDVIQVLSNHRNPPDLRLGNVVSPTSTAAISSRIDPIKPGAAIAEGSFITPETGSLFSGIAFDQDPQRVDVIVQGDVEVTICDCGDITIPVGGWPKWPLVFLGAIPFFFLPKGDEEPVPPFIPPTITQPTPTPPIQTIPEPTSLLLFASGLAAFGAGLRRRFRKSSSLKQSQTIDGE